MTAVILIRCLVYKESVTRRENDELIILEIASRAFAEQIANGNTLKKRKRKKRINSDLPCFI